MEAIGTLAETLQNNAGGLAAVWPALDAAMKAAFGHIIFSVLAYDAAGARMVRVYSNHPERIPVGGIKRVTDSEWTRRVLIEGTVFVNSNEDDIKRVFPDHERILALGCQSALNVPVRNGGIVLGSLNLLDREGSYDAVDPRLALTFAQLVAPALLTSVIELPPLSGDAPESEVEQV
jgi:GAF domain-containing protein